MNGGGPGSGIWKSTDGGDTWTRLKTGLPEGSLGRIALDVYRKRPNILYASIEGPAAATRRGGGGGGGGRGAAGGAAARSAAAAAPVRRRSAPTKRRRRDRRRTRAVVGVDAPPRASIAPTTAARPGAR